MHGVFGITGEDARNAGVSSVAEKTICDISVGEDWFANACKHLLPNKAGTALHYETGFDERSCQRYAAGDVKPPAYFLRALLRSPQGWTWLCAVMDESNESWWREARYAYEIIAVFEAKRKELLDNGDNLDRRPKSKGD